MLREYTWSKVKVAQQEKGSFPVDGQDKTYLKSLKLSNRFLQTHFKMLWYFQYSFSLNFYTRMSGFICEKR